LQLFAFYVFAHNSSLSCFTDTTNDLVTKQCFYFANKVKFAEIVIENYGIVQNRHQHRGLGRETKLCQSIQAVLSIMYESL
jgi:hypothetical protein